MKHLFLLLFEISHIAFVHIPPLTFQYQVTWLEKNAIFQLEKNPQPSFFEYSLQWKSECLSEYLVNSKFQGV